MKSFFSPIITLLTLLFLFACSTIEEKHYSKEAYPATSPSQVEVLTEIPDRPHVEIGEIKGIGSVVYQSAGDVKEDIREAAAKMGADAIILKGNTKVDYDWFQGVSHTKKAIAIKWTAPAGTKTVKPIEPAPSNSGGLPVPQPLP